MGSTTQVSTQEGTGIAPVPSVVFRDYRVLAPHMGYDRFLSRVGQVVRYQISNPEAPRYCDSEWLQLKVRLRFLMELRVAAEFTEEQVRENPQGVLPDGWEDKLEELKGRLMRRTFAWLSLDGLTLLNADDPQNALRVLRTKLSEKRVNAVELQRMRDFLPLSHWVLASQMIRAIEDHVAAKEAKS